MAGLQITPLTKQVVLSPCDSATFSFEVTGNGPVSFSVLNAPQWLNYSQPISFTVNNKATVGLLALYPCDAVPKSGLYALTLKTQQGSEQASATVYIYASSASTLDVSLESRGLACACGSTQFALTINNKGYKRETGTVLLSTQFTAAISDASFDLQPGQSTTKQIVVDLPCSTPSGVYPLSVGVVKQGGEVTYSYNGVNVAQCYASNFTGPMQVSACFGDPVNILYSVYNNGNYPQSYSVFATFGSLPFSSLVVQPHSSTVFNLSIPLFLIPIPGSYNYSISTHWGNGVQSLAGNLTTFICQGKTVPVINIAYPVLETNNSLFLTSGTNTLFISIKNTNNFSITRAALSLGEFGQISDLFNLAPNETKAVQVTFNIQSTFNSTSAVLLLDSDQGRNSRIVLIKPRSPLTGYFVLGSFVSNDNLAGIAVALVIIAGLFYYAETQRKKQALIDTHISKSLEKILAKYSRR